MPDGTTNQEHQNPIYRPGTATPNYIYVRVRNRGCQPSTSVNVRLFWAKASTGLGWPNPWTGGITTGGALMGNEAGTPVATGTIAGGSSTIVQFAWNPPNPADYMAAFGDDKGHFCLLAAIEPLSTSPMDLNTMVQNNKTIAWKNVQVAGAGGGREASTLLANYNENRNRFALSFNEVPRELSPFNDGEVYVQLPKRVYRDWLANGSQGRNISIADKNTGLIRLENSKAIISNITLAYRQTESLQLYFRTNDKRRQRGASCYFIDIKQYYDEVADNNFTGGQRVWIKTY